MSDDQPTKAELRAHVRPDPVRDVAQTPGSTTRRCRNVELHLDFDAEQLAGKGVSVPIPERYMAVRTRHCPSA